MTVATHTLGHMTVFEAHRQLRAERPNVSAEQRHYLKEILIFEMFRDGLIPPRAYISPIGPQTKPPPPRRPDRPAYVPPTARRSPNIGRPPSGVVRVTSNWGNDPDGFAAARTNVDRLFELLDEPDDHPPLSSTDTGLMRLRGEDAIHRMAESHCRAA